MASKLCPEAIHLFLLEDCPPDLHPRFLRPRSPAVRVTEIWLILHDPHPELVDGQLALRGCELERNFLCALRLVEFDSLHLPERGFEGVEFPKEPSVSSTRVTGSMESIDDRADQFKGCDEIAHGEAKSHAHVRKEVMRLGGLEIGKHLPWKTATGIFNLLRRDFESWP